MQFVGAVGVSFFVMGGGGGRRRIAKMLIKL